ncbi:MAG TPA: hypothetical protein PKA74_14765 [Bauldia sp.]|nr:hypothetical protein [Bauldia sp.]
MTWWAPLVLLVLYFFQAVSQYISFRECQNQPPTLSRDAACPIVPCPPG